MFVIAIGRITSNNLYDELYQINDIMGGYGNYTMNGTISLIHIIK